MSTGSNPYLFILNLFQSENDIHLNQHHCTLRAPDYAITEQFFSSQLQQVGPQIYFWVLNLFTVLAIYSEFAVHWYSNISSTQYETYTRHTQCHQSPGQCFCMEEAMNTVHQCKSLEWCSLLLDVHYLLFIIYLLNLFFWWLLRALRNCSSLYSTVFQSSKLLECHLDLPFLRPEAWSAGLVFSIKFFSFSWKKQTLEICHLQIVRSCSSGNT